MSQTIQHVDDNTDIFPMTRKTSGHYMRTIGHTVFETYRTDSEVMGAQGRMVPHREWFASVDGNVVASGPNNRSVKLALVRGGFVERAEENASVHEKRDAARQVLTEVFGEELPQTVQRKLDKAYGDLVDVVPAQRSKKKSSAPKSAPEPVEDVPAEPVAVQEPAPEPEPANA